MTTTPLMSLVLPTDHGSIDTWDVILDAAFGLVDSHDHTTGKGAQVPSAGLKINADVSWSSGGASRAITDLLAVDFKPSSLTLMTALAGALFVNSADNELYWRTTSGVNVKLTAGAALNVAAFTGGIGGDYSAVGALEIFDDSTDSYWFQQQVGASVRQYARLRSADVDIYEFKANPAAGVPTQRVRLQSPVSLAASYALTLPVGLPASTRSVSIDAVGQIASGISQALAINNDYTISGTGNYKHGIKTISSAVFATLMSVTAGTVNVVSGQPGIQLGNNTIAYIPLPPLPRHCRLVTISLWFGSAADATATTCGVYFTSSANPPGTTFTSNSTPLTAGGTALASAANVNLTNTNSQTFWIQVSNSVSTPRILATSIDFDAP